MQSLLLHQTINKQWNAHLSPGLQDGQCFHSGGGLVVQLAARVPPGLDFSQWGGQELMNSPQVTEVTDHTAGNPGTADLEMGLDIYTSLRAQMFGLTEITGV